MSLNQEDVGQTSVEQLDVLIIGAGISGIGMACHLNMKSPNQNYAIFEGRDSIGGTWDLFRYPGIRSDSDMYTFGYSFRPWTEGSDIAPADAILRYLQGTVTDYKLADKMRFKHRVQNVNWLTADNRWLVDYTIGDSEEVKQLSCKFLLSCTGYYNYDQGYLPEFKGYDDFKGGIAHPQHWPEDLDYSGKKVLVIGSGATAVTLVPSMADTAAHVTMLQRSPTYVITRPARDPIAKFLHSVMPDSWAHKLARVKNVFLSWFLFTKSKSSPDKMRAYLREQVKKELGDSVDVDTHFNPSYDPWDQRLCMVPDSDLFKVLKDGSASIVTDHIDCFTETGVKLKSGTSIEADIIVPATGLSLRFLGGMTMSIDGEAVNVGDLMNYKGMMFGNIPNFSSVFGYTNASWTLKSDLTSDYICRLLNHMDKHQLQRATPSLEGTNLEKLPMIGSINSGYIKRAEAIMPKQGAELPWRNQDNYYRDYFTIRFGKLDDGVMKFH